MKEIYKIILAILFFPLIASSPWNPLWAFIPFYFLVLALSLSKKEKEVAPLPISETISYFEKAQVKDAFIPLVDVVAISQKSKFLGAIRTVKKSGFSRLPVYKNEHDAIMGIVHIHDLLKAVDKDESLEAYIKKSVFVPETLSLPQLLYQMQKDGISLCVVLDEFKQISGIISLEDILEELVGEISEIGHEDMPLYKQLAPGSFLISGRMEIDQLNKKFQWDFPQDDYLTLGGFLLVQFNTIPTLGQKIQYKNFVFTIRSATEKTIKLIHIKVK